MDRFDLEEETGKEQGINKVTAFIFWPTIVTKKVLRREHCVCYAKVFANVNSVIFLKLDWKL